MNNSSTIKNKRPSLYSNLDEILSCGILSAERVAELNLEITKRISTAYLSDGTPITTSKVADLRVGDQGAIYLYPRAQTGDYHNDEYVRREVLNAILTDEEINKLSKYCSSLISARRETRLFNEAIKIPENEWSGWVAVGDTYYDGVSEFKDNWIDDNMEWDGEKKKFELTKDAEYPTYVWAAEPEKVIPTLDVSDITANWIDRHGYEGVEDDLKGVEELQAALDAFSRANDSIISYSINEKKAIILNWSENESELIKQ